MLVGVLGVAARGRECVSVVGQGTLSSSQNRLAVAVRSALDDGEIATSPARVSVRLSHFRRRIVPDDAAEKQARGFGCVSSDEHCLIVGSARAIGYSTWYIDRETAGLH